MNAVGRLGSYISRGVVSVAAPFHPFGGAVDIVVVEQEDGSFRSSPWYVQFGKFQGVLKAREKVVTINVNGVDADFRMYLDSRGGAYFVRDADGESALWGDEANGLSSMRRPMKIMSCNYDGQREQLVSDLEASKVVIRSSSSGPRMAGVTVGRNSESESAPQHQQNVVGGNKEGSMERGAEVAADLLEVRWSTSLATRKQRKGNASCNSDSESSHPHSVCNNGERNAVIPPTAAPMNYMESFTLEETYLGANAVPDSSIGSNGGDVDKCDVSEVSSSGSFIGRSADVMSDSGGMSDSDEQSSTSQVLHPDYGKRDAARPAVYRSVSRITDVPAQEHCNSGEVTSGVKSELLSSSLACETDKDKENLEKNDPCIPTDVSGTDVGTSDDDIVFETQVEVILDSKTDGPVKYVQKMVVDQVPSELDPSLTNSLLVEDILENHANLVPCEAECNGEAFTCLDPIQEESESINCGESIENKVEGSPENLSAVQFFFSDLDGSEPLRSVHTEPTSPNSLEVEETLDDFSCQLSQKALSNDHTRASKIPRTISSPMKIARVHEQVNQIPETVEPLSSTWSHGSEMNTQSVSHPISCSLDSSINAIRLAQGDIATNSGVCTLEKPSTPRHHSVQHLHNSDELRKILSDPAVGCKKLAYRKISRQHLLSRGSHRPQPPCLWDREVSLCRHLLREGMGHEAAARAFDAEKLETEMFVSLAPGIIEDDRVVVRVGGLYFPWGAALPIISAIGAPRNEQVLEPKGIINVEQAQKGVKKNPEQSIDSTNGSWRLWPFRRTKSINRRQQAIIQREPTRNTDSPRLRMKANDIQRELTRNIDSPRLMKKANDSPREAMRKPDVPMPEDLKRTLVRAKTPTSEQLASLNLKDGRNEVVFTFSTPMLGEQKVDCRIYLWKWNSRIVISDVDGTITKSDVLGQFMPMVGIDWSQTGVTHLFSGIKENGYELLFLSARAISQASLTRQFLFNLKQDGKVLPDGPVVISPDGLFPSLFREVIRRAPHEFKIACLEDIKALFPADHKPFYAGFGNRDTDEISYLKVGIPLGKIFIINPRGEVAVHRRVDTKSYTSLRSLVHDMFPPPDSKSASEQEDFNSWNFWRLPPPQIVG